MVPIIRTKNGELREHDFIAQLKKICEEHKVEKRALAFVFLAYDFGNETILKIVKDSDYWSALDCISGKYLSIFYIDTKDQYFKMRKQEIVRKEKIRSRPIAYAVPVPSKQDVSEINDRVKKEFELSDSVTMPFVIFFQTDGEIIIDYEVVQLKEDRLEDAFLELKSLIKSAVSALIRIKPEYSQNHLEIFEQLRLELNGEIIRRNVKKRIKSVSLLGLIRIFTS